MNRSQLTNLDDDYVASVKRRFFSKVTKTSSCWTWTGPLRSRYGQMGVMASRFRSRTLSAHRISWMLSHGNIPDELQVLHRCDNKKCVNPAHLFLGTNQDNMDDRDQKGRLSYGERHSISKLTRPDILAIRQLLSDGVSQVEIAKRFGISQPHVSSIKLGKSWART